MLNYNTSIKEDKTYSDLEMKEIKPIMKLIIRGKTKNFITAIGKNLNKSIALAVVRGGKNMLGQKLFIPMENKNINVTIVDPVFFDKENLRLNA